MAGRRLGALVTTPPPIVLDGLSLRHGRRDVVRGLCGQFAPGSLTAIVGPNGAGKTTLIRALAGLHPPAAGTVNRGGLRPDEIALLPQATKLDRGFPIACRDVVALGLAGRLGPFRAISRVQYETADAALASVGLPELGGRCVDALSSGQFQRVLFARMILQDAPVVLLDEPFSAVDSATTTDLLGIVSDWHAQGRTVIAVLHDLDLVRAFFPQALLLPAEPTDGAAVAWGPTAMALTEASCRRAGLLRQSWTVPHRRAA